MNKKFIAIFISITLGIILVSAGVKNIASKKGLRLMNKMDIEAQKALLDLAETYKAKNNYVKARAALLEFTERFPNSEKSEILERKIEGLNVDILFSDVITEDSVSYEIKPGDTLGRIASMHNTTIELIKNVNGLESDLILPGKHLKVNNAKYSISVDKTENILMLKKASGEIVKTYIVSTGVDFSTPTGTFKIEEKLVSPVWYKVGAIVSPNSSEYELGSRWMGLSVDGYGIHGTSDESTIGKHITKGCVRMRNNEVSELFAIVPTGTEVTIVE